MKEDNNLNNDNLNNDNMKNDDTSNEQKNRNSIDNNILPDEKKQSSKERLSEGQKSESKWNRFIWGFLIMLLPYVVLFVSFKMYQGYGVISSFFLAILFMCIGFVIWVITNFGFKKRFLALGFLIGGLAPFLVMFIFTGGCGIFIQP